MNLWSLIFGASGMYIYLRLKGVEPPPEVLKWENYITAALLKAPKSLPPPEMDIDS